MHPAMVDIEPTPLFAAREAKGNKQTLIVGQNLAVFHPHLLSETADACVPTHAFRRVPGAQVVGPSIRRVHLSDISGCVRRDPH